MALGPGHVLEGRYELFERLGRGGMGSVFRAHDDRLGREVAVKVLDGALAADPEFLARFQREARAAASLSHAGIVAVFDRGEHDGHHFIVMELIDGPTLGDVLRSEGRLPADRALAIGAAVADALAAAHRIGIVHRDVKPSNVLITPDGHVKVTDFGIARAASDVTLTTTDSVLGSVPYVAPEQVRGEAATPASDVYALGCVLYALLTGEPPFQAEAAVSVLHQHLAEDPPPPSARATDVATAVDEVVLRMLAKEPLDRPADAGRAAVLLRHAGGAQPDGAAPLDLDLLERTRVLAAPVDHTRVLPEETTLVDPEPAEPEPADEPPIRWGRRLVFLAGLVAVVIAVAMFGESLVGGGDAGAEPDAPATSPAPPVPDPSTEAPTTEPTPEPTPETLTDVIEEIGGLVSAGRGSSVHNAAADKLAERLFKVVEEVGKGDWEKARQKTVELRAELDKRSRSGQVTQERSKELADAIDRLEALLPTATET